MGETVPDRIWIDLQAVIDDDEGHRVTYDSENIHHEYVPATALEAAQARIAELEARPTIKTHDGTVAVIISDVEIAATARREALEEAAKEIEKLSGWPGCDYSTAIRALMENPNG